MFVLQKCYCEKTRKCNINLLFQRTCRRLSSTTKPVDNNLSWYLYTEVEAWQTLFVPLPFMGEQVRISGVS